MDETGHSGDAGAAEGGDGADPHERTRLNGWATPDSPWSHPGAPLEQENDVPAWRRPAPENRPSSGVPLPAPTPPGFVDARPTGEIPPSGAADRWGETRSRYSDLLAPLAPPPLPSVPEQSRPGGGSFGSPAVRSEPGQSTGGFGSREPGQSTGGFGSREPGQSTGGFGSREPGQSTGGFGSREPGQTTGSFGNGGPAPTSGGFGSSEPTPTSGGLGSSEPAPTSGGFGRSEPGQTTGGFGNIEPGQVTGGFGSPAAARPSPLRAFDVPTPSSAPPYPYEGDLDDAAPPAPPQRATTAVPLVRPAAPGGRRADWIASEMGQDARHALSQGTPIQGTPIQGTPVTGSPVVPERAATPEPPRVVTQPENPVGDEAKLARPSYDPSSFPRGQGYEPSPAAETSGYTPPPAYAGFGGRDAGPVRPGDPGAARATESADQGARSLLPQRVPAQPDVPRVPEPPLVEPTAETPALARIATHLRRGDVLPAQERQEGFDVQAILAAVREVAGVRDASLRTTPAGAHSLRLDLAEGADPAEVSRRVARLLQDRMGLDAAMKGEALPPLPPPTSPVSPARATAPVSPPPRDASLREGRPRGSSLRDATYEDSAQRDATRQERRDAAFQERPDAAFQERRDAASRETSLSDALPRETSLREAPRRERERERHRESTLSDVQPAREAAPGPAMEAPPTRAAPAAREIAPARETSSTQASAPTRAKPVERAPEKPAQHERHDDEPRIISETAIVPSGVETPPRPLYPAHDPGPRIVIENVQVNTFGTDATVEVRLGVGGRSAAGEASGPAVDGYLLRLCAMATAAAVDQLLSTTDHPEGPVRCFVEHAAAVPFGASHVAVAVLLLSWNGWVEQLAGSAVVTGDDRLAMVRATLAAVNRRLEALLSG
ncbi:hypothetical protein ACIA5C_31410 [Actinoplanes sp. NPDC051343]|uniref:hypothetical protein n=1 Tax=Actinoplanes sp. NPDC051343 TaxID=3363906 RepID=UPI0037AD6ABA